MPNLSNARFLILATSRFEESELFGPKEILEQQGAEVTLASLSRDAIVATVRDELGKTITPDLTVGEVDIADYDALILPGGVGNPDRLRMDAGSIALIRDFAATGKPVGAICHGPWLLAEADLLRGRTVTAWPSIRTDLRNAGAKVVDEPSVTSGNIVTSRKPEDVPEFTAAIASLVIAGRQQSQRAL